MVEATNASNLANNPNCAHCKDRAEKEKIEFVAAEKSRYICLTKNCTQFQKYYCADCTDFHEHG